MNLAARTAAVALVWTALASIGCISRHPATDTGDTATAATAASPISPTAPTSPTTPTPAPSPTPTPAPVTVLVAYDKDIAPVLNTDCLRCHGGSKPDAGYSVATYALVLKKVLAGDARSPLVTSTQARGSMYRYLSGNAAAKADLIRRWVVDYNAAATR